MTRSGRARRSHRNQEGMIWQVTCGPTRIRADLQRVISAKTQAGAGRSRRGRQHGLERGPVTGKTETCKGGRLPPVTYDIPTVIKELKGHFRVEHKRQKTTRVRPESVCIPSPRSSFFGRFCVRNAYNISCIFRIVLFASCAQMIALSCFLSLFVVFRNFTARRRARGAGDV